MSRSARPPRRRPFAGERAGTLIAGRFVRKMGSRSGSTTRTDSILASMIGSAPSQKGFSTADTAPRQRWLSMPPSSGRMIISNGFERWLPLVPSKVMTTTLLRFEDAVDEAADEPLVLFLPERREGEALELAAVDGAEPRSRQPENRLVARVPFQDEGVGEQSLDVGRLDLRAFRGGAAVAKAIPILEQRN